jgi:crotonobetainyl-CoA:carnitine CoA-transferase CaiB-like acyl-CoA transferase
VKTTVLAGIRVLDLSTGPVGGFATMVLADFGADVVKVEPPGGDRFRALATSPLWLRGKRSTVIDLSTDDGREQVYSLVETADVLVVSGLPGRSSRWGLDPARTFELNASLVHCSITPWGRRGPYAEFPGYEGLVAAKSGRMLAFAAQLPREGPVYAAVPVASHAASHGAVHGVLAALLAREGSGRGQRVETSLLQGILPYDLWAALLHQLLARTDQPPPDPKLVGGMMPTLNYHPVLAKDDRWIQCGNLLEHLFLSFLDAIDLLAELLEDGTFQGPPATWSWDAIERARDRILLRMREKTAAEWMEIFRGNGNVAAEPFLDIREALDLPDLVDNGAVVEVEDPDRGSVRQIGPIARLTETPAVPVTPAPRIGEHTDEVLSEVRPRTEVAPLQVSMDAGPLADITVLEIATVIAAPLATSLLADLGARVIKVEPITGDPYRHLLPRGELAVKTNAGKESICIDLKSERGKDLLRELVRRADALVHNFRPGVPERLGFGYDQACELRPGIVWVALNGYGPDGPSARRPATHPVMGAAAGGAVYQAGAALAVRCETLGEIREISRQLMQANEANPDPTSSVVGASATLLALLARKRHGIGQAVFVDMLTANACANADYFLQYEGKPPRPPLDPDLYGLEACYRLYAAKEGWVFLAVPSDRDFARFCAAVDRDDLARDPRFSEREARREHDDALTAEIAFLFQQRDANSWETLLSERNVGCVRADGASVGEFFTDDPHILANGLAPRCRHARFGKLRRWGPLTTVDGALPGYGPSPLAGEHTDALLEELGHTVAEIARLREAGVVASEPIQSP